jgi:TatD DNase family protein
MNTTFVDTHCHLNFKRFNKTREQVLLNTFQNKVDICIIPGTDPFSSLKAVEIASTHDNLYAAVGIHPHHAMQALISQNAPSDQFISDMEALEKLLVHPKVVAVGEVGLDRHVYEETKYPTYQISTEFIELQKKYFTAQVLLAQKYQKALIIHNRETKSELLSLLSSHWSKEREHRTVFHCCEPDSELLEYAKDKSIYIGVDGDVTYGGEKAAFAKQIPLELLVLETDSPFILPEPLRAQKLYPNTPANIPLIAQCIADLKGVALEEIAKVTTRNAKALFGLNKDIPLQEVAF